MLVDFRHPIFLRTPHLRPRGWCGGTTSRMSRPFPDPAEYFAETPLASAQNWSQWGWAYDQSFRTTAYAYTTLDKTTWINIQYAQFLPWPPLIPEHQCCHECSIQYICRLTAVSAMVVKGSASAGLHISCNRSVSIAISATEWLLHLLSDARMLLGNSNTSIYDITSISFQYIKQNGEQSWLLHPWCCFQILGMFQFHDSIGESVL